MKHIPTASLINIPIVQKIMNSRVTLKNYFGKKHEDDRNTDFVEVKNPQLIYLKNETKDNLRVLLKEKKQSIYI